MEPRAKKSLASPKPRALSPSPGKKETEHPSGLSCLRFPKYTWVKTASGPLRVSVPRWTSFPGRLFRWLVRPFLKSSPVARNSRPRGPCDRRSAHQPGLLSWRAFVTGTRPDVRRLRNARQAFYSAKHVSARPYLPPSAPRWVGGPCPPSTCAPGRQSTGLLNGSALIEQYAGTACEAKID